MSIKIAVEEYLKSEPRFRERKEKDRGMVYLLGRRYGTLGMLLKRGEISYDTMIAVIQDAYSMDRAWRQALQHNPELRGTDYEDKTILEAEKQLELGYTPGYHADIKKLKKL
jgi:hypothetical protein